jgi:methylaspartate mutase sigma subunit
MTTTVCLPQNAGSGPTGPRVPASPPSLAVVVSSVASDSHTWNLVYLQLLLEDLGHQVTNLGSCVTPELLTAECLARPPDLVVISSVNGHGHLDGLQSIRRLRERTELAGLPVVIGGQLGITGTSGQDRRDELLRAGFDGVFEGDDSLTRFFRFLRPLRAKTARVSEVRR